jgi:hypothetical protein
MKKLALVLALLSCHVVRAEPRAPDQRCTIIETALAIGDAEFQRFYKGGACTKDATGRERGALLVEVRGLAFKDGETCRSKAFSLYDDKRTRTSSHKVLQLEFRPLDDGATWAFDASYVDPQPAETADGGFDAVDYYCHVIDGRVGRQQQRWRAWVQHAKPQRATR